MLVVVGRRGLRVGGWEWGCRGKGGLIESKSRHFTVGCMCMFVVHPVLCEANVSPSTIAPFFSLILTLEVTFKINRRHSLHVYNTERKDILLAKGSDCYLLLPALLFLIQASLFTQSLMLQGLTDPPPLHPALMRNHMTGDANTSGCADPLHPPLPSAPAQNPGGN